MKKVFKYIGIGIDWINKNLPRIKTISLILVFILFIISFINNGCNRDYANRLVERITGLDIQNDILSLHNRAITDSLNKERILRIRLQFTKDSLLKIKNSLAVENTNLKKKLNAIPQWLLNMPADSSYKFLNEVAYNYPGEKQFPFNEPQVKNIHADYLENVHLTGLVSVLEDQLVNCEIIGEKSDSLTLSFQKSYNMVSNQKNNLEEIVSNTEVKATTYKDALDKSERRKKFWKTTTTISTTIAIIFGLLL